MFVNICILHAFNAVFSISNYYNDNNTLQVIRTFLCTYRSTFQRNDDKLELWTGYHFMKSKQNYRRPSHLNKYLIPFNIIVNKTVTNK